MPCQPGTCLEGLRGSVLLPAAEARDVRDTAPTLPLMCLPTLPLEAWAHPRLVPHSRVSGKLHHMELGMGHLKQNKCQKRQGLQESQPPQLPRCPQQAYDSHPRSLRECIPPAQYSGPRVGGLLMCWHPAPKLRSGLHGHPAPPCSSPQGAVLSHPLQEGGFSVHSRRGLMAEQWTV